MIGTLGRWGLLAVLLLGGGVGGLPASGAQALPGGADTLTAAAAVRQALAEAPRVRAAQQRAQAAHASVRAARSAWFPVLEGQAQYRRLSDNVDYTVDLPSIPGAGGERVTFAPAILNRYAARARLRQPLFTGLRVPSRVEAAQAEQRAASAEVRDREQAVAYETRTAYWTLYEARARRAAAATALRQIEQRLADVRNRRAAGRATEADVLRVQARRDRVRVEQVQARNAVRSARRALNDLLGRPLDRPVVIADTVRLRPVPGPDTALVARARRQRPDLEALRQTVRAREAEVGVARAEWFPEVALTGSYLYARPNEQLFPPEDRFEGSWEAGVTLSWELALGGRADAATDRAQARRQAARYELQDRRRAAALAVRSERQNVAQAREAVEAARTSVRSARAAYRSVQSRYEAGMAVVADLLDAEQALRGARTALAGAEADYARARAALDRALGRRPWTDAGRPR
jgi:outer membrane protein